MIKHLLLLIWILLSACQQTTTNKSLFNGIWIPEKINWMDGNFETFFISNDTSLTLLSSTQKLINDSIYFQAEPGFIFRHGIIRVRESGKFEITYRILYRFISLPGDTTPSKIIKEDVSHSKDLNQIVKLTYKGVNYIKTTDYTRQSEKTIKSIATKMIHINK
jgi:hypothetical protein